MTHYTLGLDLGCNSVGWAMIAGDGETFDNGSAILAGVRVFPEGLDTRKDKVGTPPGQHRRLKRSERRSHFRRSQRRRQLLKLLVGAGLLPASSDERRELFNRNPYPLRAKGVTEQLTPHEFGRVLYHLIQRRGFQSNKRIRKSDDEAKKDKDAEKEANSLKATLDKERITLGQYLARFVPKDKDPTAHKDASGRKEWVRNRLRNDAWYHRQSFRHMYKAEFDVLWGTQTKPWGDTTKTCQPSLNAELRKAVYEAIFNQRPVWWPLDSIGRCDLTGEERCPKGHWWAQEFRMQSEINNLTVFNEDTGEVRELTSEERTTLADKLRMRKSMLFKEMHDHLVLKPEESFRSFEADARRKGLGGNAVEAALLCGGLRSWYETHGSLREEVYGTLVEIERDEARNRAYGLDEASLRQKGKTWGLSESQADELCNLMQELPEGYLQYSLSAIRKLIPLLRQGLTADKAVAAAGFKPKATPVHDRLPPLDQVAPYLTNPRVRRALSEARKVVNLLISLYGKPEEIVVELAREMKQSRKHREELLKRNKELEALNKEAEEEMRKLGQPVNEENRLRYRLWKEMMAANNACCPSPYSLPDSQRRITLTNLFTPEVQIDHIHPRSRTFCNAFSNKVLCFADENSLKGNQIPYQWLHHDQGHMDAVLRRVRGLPKEKKRRFSLQSLDGLQAFIDRQLDDARFTARQAVSYLKVLGRPVHCVQGYTTAPLRRCWGFKKDRFDNRHHAVDAIVIALTTAKHLHALSNLWADRNGSFAPPWSTFRHEVQTVMDELQRGEKNAVSRRPNRSLSGALHDEAGYGPVRDRQGKLRQGVSGLYVYATRKKVQDLTPDMINEDDTIGDATIRNIIRAECVARKLAREPTDKKDKVWLHEGKPYTIKAKPGRKLADPPPLLPARPRKPGQPITFTPIKRVRIHLNSGTAELVRKVGGRPAKYVLPEGNHHIEIYRTREGNWVGHQVSYFEGHRRWRKQVALSKKTRVPQDLVVNRAGSAGETFVTFLCEDDMVWLNNLKTGARDLYYVVSKSVDDKTKGPDICFYHHTLAKLPDKKEAARDDRVRMLRDSLRQEGRAVRVRNWPELMEKRRMEKVSVDPVGRVFPCHD